MFNNKILLNCYIYNNFEDCQNEIKKIYAESNCNNPFLSLEWLMLWWEYFHKNKYLHIIVFRYKDKGVGYAPFYVTKKFIFDIYEFRLLGDNISNYLDIVCVPGYEEIVLETLFLELQSMVHRIVVVIKDINNRFSCIYRALSEINLKGCVFKSTFYLYPCPLALIGNDWREFFIKRRSSKSREKLRRYEKLINKQGKFSFQEICKKDVLSLLIPKLKTIHDKRFDKTDYALFEGQRGLFIGAALNKFLNNIISLTIVELDRDLISFCIGLTMGQFYIDYAKSFDPAYKSFRIGTIHLIKLMEKKTKEGYNYFDFSRGEYDYKKWWSNDETHNYLFIYGFKLNLRGLTYFFAINIIQHVIGYIRKKGYNNIIKKKFNWIFKYRSRYLSM